MQVRTPFSSRSRVFPLMSLMWKERFGAFSVRGAHSLSSSCRLSAADFYFWQAGSSSKEMVSTFETQPFSCRNSLFIFVKVGTGQSFILERAGSTGLIFGRRYLRIPDLSKNAFEFRTEIGITTAHKLAEACPVGIGPKEGLVTEQEPSKWNTKKFQDRVTESQTN